MGISKKHTCRKYLSGYKPAGFDMVLFPISNCTGGFRVEPGMTKDFLEIPC